MCSFHYATCIFCTHRCRYEFRIQLRQRIVIEPSEKIYSIIVKGEKKCLFMSTWWGINRVPKTKPLGGILFKWDQYYCCLLINQIIERFHISQKGIILCRIWKNISTFIMTTSVWRLAYVILWTTMKINVWKTTKSVFRRSSLISWCWLRISPCRGSEHCSLFLWKFATQIA